MSSDFVFRKAAFGGFNRDDVIAYINEAKINEAKLETEKELAQKRADELAEEIEALKASINELKSEHEAKINRPIAPQKNVLKHINKRHHNIIRTCKPSHSTIQSNHT